jgi:hypothetical protein
MSKKDSKTGVPVNEPGPAYIQIESNPHEPLILAGIGHHRGSPRPFEDDDRPLVGGRAIQEFHNRLLGVDLSLSAIFKQLVNGSIPANKTAGTWISSERKLRQHYARTTNGADRAAA